MLRVCIGEEYIYIPLGLGAMAIGPLVGWQEYAQGPPLMHARQAIPVSALKRVPITACTHAMRWPELLGSYMHYARTRGIVVRDTALQ